MDYDDLWKELDLSSLLKYPQPQLISDNKIKKHSSKLDPFLKHENKWRKSNYSALKSRYEVIPNQPKLYRQNYINRLADPIKGKYSKYDDIMNEAAVHTIEQDSNKIKKHNEDDSNSYDGFFITEDLNKNNDVDNESIDENNRENSLIRKKYGGSAIRKKFDDAIKNSYKNNRSNWKSKFNIQTNTKKSYKKKKVIPPYRIPIILDNIRSSGYGYNIKQKNVLAQPKWKIDRLEQYNNFKNSPNKLHKVTKNDKTRSQSATHILLESIENNDTQNDNNTINLKYRSKNRLAPIPYSNNTVKKVNKMIRSAPNLTSGNHEATNDSNRENLTLSKKTNANVTTENLNNSENKASLSRPKRNIVKALNDSSVTKSRTNFDTLTRDLKYKTTEQLLETLQRIENNDLKRNDEDVKLTMKLSKHLKSISSSIAIAESHISGYKDITTEDLSNKLDTINIGLE